MLPVFANLTGTKGYTLIELLVVIVVMTMIGLAMYYYSVATLDQQRRGEFYSALDGTVSLISEVRTNAITNATLDSGAVPAAYGLHIDIDSPATLTAFVDDNDGSGNGRYDPPLDPDNPTDADDTIINEYELDENYNVELQQIASGNTSAFDDELVFLFAPPDAEMEINNNGSPQTSAVSGDLFFSYDVPGTGGAIGRHMCFHKVSRFFEISFAACP